MPNPEYKEIGKYVGPSDSYLQLRRKVMADAKKMDKVSPCQKGKGFCCTAHVGVSVEESQEIISAARDKKIPDTVIKRVAQNLADENNGMCPFLGKTNNCMIYEYRPLECVNFGRGALIVTEEGSREASQVLKGEREDGLKEPGVKPRLCEHCQPLRDPDISYPVTLLVSSQAAIGYYQMQPVRGSLNDVARTLTTGEPTPFFLNDERLPFEDASLDAVLHTKKGPIS